MHRLVIQSRSAIPQTVDRPRDPRSRGDFCTPCRSAVSMPGACRSRSRRTTCGSTGRRSSVQGYVPGPDGTCFSMARPTLLRHRSRESWGTRSTSATESCASHRDPHISSFGPPSPRATGQDSRTGIRRRRLCPTPWSARQIRVVEQLSFSSIGTLSRTRCSCRGRCPRSSCPQRRTRISGSIRDST